MICRRLPYYWSFVPVTEGEWYRVWYFLVLVINEHYKDSNHLLFIQKLVTRSLWEESISCLCLSQWSRNHDDVMKWTHFPRYWPFVRGIHRSPVNSPHKGQWRGALMFSLICVWINGWVNSREAGDLRRHRVHYDVIVMIAKWFPCHNTITVSASDDPVDRYILVS